MRILWIPHTGWHIPQRAHLFCRALAERHEVHVTDLWADFAGWRDYLSLRYLRNYTYRRYRDGAITVHGVPRISPALFSRRLRQLNERLFSALVSRLIERQRIDVVVGTFVVPPPWAPRLVFDMFDENVAGWRTSLRYQSYADEINAIENQYVTRSDAIVVVSAPLLEKVQRMCPRGSIHLIPNGVDVVRFAEADGQHLRDKLGLEGVVAGTIGNHDRFDELKLIVEVAELCADLPLTFIIGGRGAAVAPAMEYARRIGLRNIRFIGPVLRDQLPETIAALDIGLCPYARTEMDHARSPMRLLAYAAAGLPIVCTDLIAVRQMGFPNVLLLENTAVAFAEGIRKIISATSQYTFSKQVEEYDLSRLVQRYEAVLVGM